MPFYIVIVTSKIFDNSISKYQLKTIVTDLLKSENYSEVSIATGYWDLPGMVVIFDELIQFLSRENISFRLLLGEEPSVKTYLVKKSSQVDPDFPQKYLKHDLEELNLKPEFQKVADLLSDNLKKEEKGSSKLQIRCYKKSFLHAKCYIFGSENENAIGIIGSSNFTAKGLTDNLELNQLEDNNATVNYRRLNINQHPSHRSWFEALWNESEDWTKVFKEELLDVSKHGAICFSPYEMYIHALYRIYAQELEDEKEDKVHPDDPLSGKPQLIRFQIQNANSIIRKLERQGVAMLSDSVGLGKTYTALKVIEYYMFSKEKNQRVVVICPAGLKPQWRQAFNDFRFNHLPEIYSMQDVNEIDDVKKSLRSIPVGLFVFDESHNLRSTGGKRFDVFINWKIDNRNSKTLLVTATPINNQLTDLSNQIELGIGGEFENLGREYDRVRQKYFTLKERMELIRKEINRELRDNGIVDYNKLKEQLTPLLNRILVRRTRQGIEKEYPEGLEINGTLQKFPLSLPFNLEYEVQNEFRTPLLLLASKFPALEEMYKFEVDSFTNLEFLAHPLDLISQYRKHETPIKSSLEIIYTGLLSLGFPGYRYNMYRHAYYGQNIKELKLNVDQNRELSRQIGIYGIFRTIFLKRLESSLNSIHISLNNYERKLLAFKKHLNEKKLIISVKDLLKLDELIALYNPESGDEDTLDFDLDALDEAEITYVEADRGRYDIDQMNADIEKDLSILGILKQQVALLLDTDNKIQELANKLDQFPNKKVLVFTYFADTLKYLSEKLPSKLTKKRNIEFALGNKIDIENFACRFSPEAKKYQLQQGEKEIDFLVATDKLSEGQNLQDCGILINYDLHWNPVRMIQRNGRVNRIGTRHKEIFIYNFRPTEQLESYLSLVRKLQDKINLIRYTVGTDQSVLDEEPVPQDFTEDLYSRDEKKRMAAFQKIFETSELLAAEDLYLDDLRAFDVNENFSEEYKEKIRDLPKGKWGSVMMKKSDDDYTHLAHVSDQNDDAGYFIMFGSNHGAEMLSPSEGLLLIKATSDQNERFRDHFANKPQTEEKINNFITEYVMREERRDPYTDAQRNVINLLLQKMQEYGEPVESIQEVYQLMWESENAYLNKQSLKLVRLANRNVRNNIPISSELISEFTKLAKQFKPGEKSEKVPLSDVLQIFVR